MSGPSHVTRNITAWEMGLEDSIIVSLGIILQIMSSYMCGEARNGPLFSLGFVFRRKADQRRNNDPVNRPITILCPSTH